VDGKLRVQKTSFVVGVKEGVQYHWEFLCRTQPSDDPSYPSAHGFPVRVIVVLLLFFFFYFPPLE